MNLEQYRAALAHHDWYYAYSDDHSVYTRGRDAREELRKAQRQLDSTGELWNEHAPAEFQIFNQGA